MAVNYRLIVNPTTGQLDQVVDDASLMAVNGVVATYNDLPPAGSNNGKFYWVESSQGTWWLPGTLGGTYYNKGLYYSNGVDWTTVETPYQATLAEANAGTVTDKFITPYTFRQAGDARYAQVGTDGTNFEPVISITNTPPAHVNGDRYLVGTSPTGAWVGYANYIAESDGANWTFTAPIADYRVQVNSTLITYLYSGGSWTQTTATPILQGGNSLGANMIIGTNDNKDVIIRRNATIFGRIFNTGLQLYGSPTSTTPPANNNSTRIATTAYVDNAVSSTDATADNFLLGGM